MKHEMVTDRNKCIDHSIKRASQQMNKEYMKPSHNNFTTITLHNTCITSVPVYPTHNTCATALSEHLTLELK